VTRKKRMLATLQAIEHAAKRVSRRNRIKATLKAYWTPEQKRLASEQAKARFRQKQAQVALLAHLAPLWQAAYDECFRNKWPYASFNYDSWSGNVIPPREPIRDDSADYDWRAVWRDGQWHWSVWRKVA
jgi:hypothetical protein